MLNIVKVVVKYRLQGLIISNTTVSRNVKSKYKNEIGGLSGKPLFEKSTKVLITVKKIVKKMGSDISIIAAGGVDDGVSAYIKILCGADLVQLYTSMIYKGPFVVRNILNELHQFKQRDGIKNWNEVKGLADNLDKAYKIVKDGI